MFESFHIRNLTAEQSQLLLATQRLRLVEPVDRTGSVALLDIGANVSLREPWAFVAGFVYKADNPVHPYAVVNRHLFDWRPAAELPRDLIRLRAEVVEREMRYWSSVAVQEWMQLLECSEDAVTEFQCAYFRRWRDIGISPHLDHLTTIYHLKLTAVDAPA